MITDMELRQQAAALWRAYLLAPVGPEENEAFDAYDALDCPALEIGDDDDAIICKASGAPIWEDEGYVTDPYTGESWLRSVIGLPPRPDVSAGPSI